MISMFTLNVRIQSVFDGKHALKYRKDGIIDCLRDELPDIIGFQEMMLDTFEAFRDAMPEYQFIGRGSKRRGNGEFTAIAFRRATIVLEEQDTFWLSTTPDRPGSRFLLQSPDARTCTWGTFRHIETGHRFRYFNTHLDHLSWLARARGIGVIFSRMAKCQTQEWLPLFWGGDMNFSPTASAYADCIREKMADRGLVDLTEHVKTTFHWYGLLRRPIKLDYIFTDETTASDDFDVHVLQTAPDGRYLSDHSAIRIDWRPGEHPQGRTLLEPELWELEPGAVTT